MKKPAKPWYRKFNDTWYVCIGGNQVKLAKGKANKAEADRAFYKIMAGDSPQAAKAADTRVVAVFDLFLDHSQKHNAPATYEWYKNFLQDFSDLYGTMKVEDLKPFHVTRWIDAHKDWKGAVWGAVTAVKRAFNWAADEGLIGENPIKKVKKPAMKVRERYLTTEERAKILASYPENDPFRDFLFAMDQTGCRPGEVAAVTSEQVDLEGGAWVFRQHKTAKKTGEDRVVVLTAAMLEFTRDRVAKVPTGTPLFRNEDGERWTSNAIRCRFRRMRKKLGLGEGVVAYLYRHAVATDLLESGAGLAQTAEILGHKDTKMITRHYSKLSERREHLRDQINKLRGPASDPKAD